MATSYPKAKKRRLFIGFSEISGYFNNLRDGLIDLGYPCDIVELSPHTYRYRDLPSSDGRLVSLIRSVKTARGRARSGILKKFLFVISGALMVPLFFVAVGKYRVFLFSNGSSFFIFNLDLILLRLLGKRVIMPFMGSEARPGYIDGFRSFADSQELYRFCKWQRRRLRFIERFVDVVVNNPAAGHLLERPFISGYCLGIPLAFEGMPADPMSRESGTDPEGGRRSIRILHSPSDLTGKGTALIRAMVQDLIGRGHRIEYRELSGRPHREVIDEIYRCDLVVDQTYSDTPMAAFASEAAWAGVPAVVGGYYADYIGGDVPRDLIPPSLFVVPDEMEMMIERAIVDADLRRELGEKARQFVRTRWSRREVASRYVRLFEGDVPQEWWFDPRSTRYPFGAGLSGEQVQSRVSGLIRNYGPESLELEDKIELEGLYCAMAGRERACTGVPGAGEGEGSG